MQKISIILPFLLFLISCTEKRYSPVKPEKNFQIKFDYLHKDILPSTGNKPEEKIKKIKEKHPSLSRGIFEEVLGVGNPDSLFTQFRYAGFLADPYIIQTEKAIDSVYTDFTKYEKEYSEAFAKYQWYTPEAITPSVVFSYNNFQYAIIALDSCMIVGLEMYLGSNFPGYVGLEWPDYIKARRTPELLVPETMTGWLMTEFPKSNTAVTFIEEIVYRGKIMFYLSKLLPDYEEHKWFGYSKEGYEFALKNEGNIYGFFIEKKLFYSEDQKEIKKYTEEAPFATGMPRETPGRIAWFLGYKIVESYMKNYEETTIDQLMKNHDYKTIFTKSKYKPKK